MSYQVIKAGDKFFKIQVGNREETISIDRLKRAHVDESNPVVLGQPPPRGRPTLQLNNNLNFNNPGVPNQLSTDSSFRPLWSPFDNLIASTKL